MANHPVETFYEALAEDSLSKAQEVFADEATWLVPGVHPGSGLYRGREAVLSLFFPGGYTKGNVKVAAVVVGHPYSVGLLLIRNQDHAEAWDQAAHVFQINDDELLITDGVRLNSAQHRIDALVTKAAPINNRHSDGYFPNLPHGQSIA